jgi:hypothetical protein
MPAFKRATVIPFQQCSICGSKMETAKVEKSLFAGGNLVAVCVEAEVCSCCGENLYSVESVKQFELLRTGLYQQESEPC